MHVNIKDIIKFIRDNDILKTYTGWSNNKLRKYVLLGLRNKCIYLYTYNNKLYGLIEYYRGYDYKWLAKNIIRSLKKNKLPISLDQGMHIWVNNIIYDIRNNPHRLVKGFKKFIHRYQNIYWWRIKHNKIVIRKLKREE